jgi:hypothetical protein
VERDTLRLLGIDAAIMPRRVDSSDETDLPELYERRDSAYGRSGRTH